ncbi:MAG TPA: penicillin acylase family protein, partial [Gammaproteobacteria bacterium]|nr:penicillin acylase family protein [Gammaproteobacteria bacterium]
MRRLAIRLGAGLAGLLLLLVLAGYGFLRGAAPVLDGTRPLQGLSAKVSVERDSLGVPVITAESRADAARALGFLHAQDRFFQMDLLRRVAAGELAELFGAAAVEFDEQHRLYRLRSVARQVLARATPEQRAVLTAYSEGVNAGLKALGTWPFEYGVLLRRPRAWQPEDSILVIDAMYFELQDPADRRESNLAVMRELMTPALYRFLAVTGTQWDAPVSGKAPEMPPIPGADVIDLRKRLPGATAAVATDSPESPWVLWLDSVPPGAIGSNNFAVSAAHGADGHAILANDMHLGLRVPNIWYRAELRYRDARAEGGQVAVTGVTLPGLPQIVAGSNRHAAWGYTNSYGDWVDLVELRLNPADADEYLAPDGWRHFEHHTEFIRVKGGADAKLEVRDTLWGPVLDRDHAGVTRAVHWVAADPDATNLELEGIERARDVREAMAVANRAGMPEQNFLTADSAGRIAWTIAGRIPVRQGYDPSRPSYWDKPGTGWSGWLPPEQYPRITDPDNGRLWTANARVVDGAMLAAVGDGGYDLGARAGQIRDDLLGRDALEPADLLAIELDDRALFLARWRTLLLALLNP